MQILPVKLKNTHPGGMPTGKPDLARARTLVSMIKDPEIPVLTIDDLGILRDLELEGQTLVVTITPTYSGCPAMHGIEQDIRKILTGAGYRVEVKTSLRPAWTTDWLTQAGRDKLSAFGIAPPAEASSNKLSLVEDDPVIGCPRCDSTHTRKLSEFGSTACKALYTCDDCQQPFDYFKCL